MEFPGRARSVRVARRRGAHVASVAADCDHQCANQLRKKLAGRDGPVIVDLRRCTYLSAAACSAIIARGRVSPVALVWDEAGEPHAAFSRIAGDLYPRYASITQALASLGNEPDRRFR